jgi:hypothetical protein
MHLVDVGRGMRAHVIHDPGHGRVARPGSRWPVAAVVGDDRDGGVTLARRSYFRRGYGSGPPISGKYESAAAR